MELLPAEIQGVLDHYRHFGPFLDAEELTSHTGLSGARIWKVRAITSGGGQQAKLLVLPSEVATTTYCLRQWPQQHPSEPRLRDIHRWVLRAASKLSYVPAPLRTSSDNTFVLADGHFWELQPWMPGSPTSATVSRPKPKNGVRVLYNEPWRSIGPKLAEFHQFAGEEHERSTGVAPASLERFEQCQWLRQSGLQKISQCIQADPLGSPPLDTLARTAVAQIESNLPSLISMMERACNITTSIMPVIRDVRPEHWLYVDGRLEGMVDFGAMRCDAPEVDVARMCELWLECTPLLSGMAFSSYERSVPWKTDINLFLIYMVANNFLGAANWLKWLYVERRQIATEDYLIRRLQVLTSNMDWIATGEHCLTRTLRGEIDAD